MHRPRPRRPPGPLAACAAALAVAAALGACGGKGLGTGTVGRNIGQAFGPNVIGYAPDDRPEPLRWRGTTLDGQTITSESLVGSVTVINFWASWCAPCRVEQPALERLWRRYRDRGVRFLGVNIRDTLTNARVHVEDFGVTYPSIFDPGSAVAHKFRVLRIPPSTFVLDRAGRIAWKITGEAREDQLARILEAELAR